MHEDLLSEQERPVWQHMATLWFRLTVSSKLHITSDASSGARGCTPGYLCPTLRLRQAFLPGACHSVLGPRSFAASTHGAQVAVERSVGWVCFLSLDTHPHS